MPKNKDNRTPKERMDLLKGLSEKTEIALFQIESEYITDPERRSLEWWYESVSGLFNLATLRDFAKEQRWRDRRQAFWRGVQAQWLRQKAQELIQIRTEELREATTLKTAVYDFCKPKTLENGQTVWPIKPKSYEGLINAFAQLDNMVESKREVIASMIDPMLDLMNQEQAIEEGEAKRKFNVPFDAKEMREMAHSLINKRRTERRAAILIEDNDNDDDETTVDPKAETHKNGMAS